MATFPPLAETALNQAATYCVSDTHLQDSSPASADAFCRLLEAIRDKAEALYLLGDLFEAWLGDDDVTPFNQRVIDELKRSSDAHPCYFIPGNRDLLIGKRFYRDTGITPLEDPRVVTLYGTRYLLSHGDRYCLDDKTHQRFRRITEKHWLRQAVCLLPLTWRRGLAKRLRQRSRAHQQQLTRHYLDVTPAAIEQALSEHHCNAMIHGHTHAPAKHLVASHAHKHRWVLSDWEGDSAVILRIDEAGPALFRWAIEG